MCRTLTELEHIPTYLRYAVVIISYRAMDYLFAGSRALSPEVPDSGAYRPLGISVVVPVSFRLTDR